MRATEQCKLSEDSIELGDPAVGTGEDVERTCPYIAVETGANYWEGAAHGTNRVSRADTTRNVVIYDENFMTFLNSVTIAHNP